MSGGGDDDSALPLRTPPLIIALLRALALGDLVRDGACEDGGSSAVFKHPAYKLFKRMISATARKQAPPPGPADQGTLDSMDPGTLGMFVKQGAVPALCITHSSFPGRTRQLWTLTDAVRGTSVEGFLGYVIALFGPALRSEVTAADGTGRVLNVGDVIDTDVFVTRQYHDRVDWKRVWMHVHRMGHADTDDVVFQVTGAVTLRSCLLHFLTDTRVAEARGLVIRDHHTGATVSLDAKPLTDMGHEITLCVYLPEEDWDAARCSGVLYSAFKTQAKLPSGAGAVEGAVEKEAEAKIEADAEADTETDTETEVEVEVGKGSSSSASTGGGHPGLCSVTLTIADTGTPSTFRDARQAAQSVAAAHVPVLLRYEGAIVMPCEPCPTGALSVQPILHSVAFSNEQPEVQSCL